MQTVSSELSLANSVKKFPGTRFHVRSSSAETSGTLAVMDVFMMAGFEQCHGHSGEDETVIINSGELNYFIGDEVITVKKGDTLFLPRGVQHRFTVMSSTAFITLVITPDGPINFYEKAAFSLQCDHLPPVTNRPLAIERLERIN